MSTNKELGITNSLGTSCHPNAVCIELNTSELPWGLIFLKESYTVSLYYSLRLETLMLIDIIKILYICTAC